MKRLGKTGTRAIPTATKATEPGTNSPVYPDLKSPG